MILERVIGDIVKINIQYEKMEILWISVEYSLSDINKSPIRHPSIWFKYKNWLYLAICDYEFQFLEQYDDWTLDNGKVFNEYNPGKNEIDRLLKMNPIYFKVLPEEIYKSDLGNYCEFELDFIKKWNRDKKINDILE